jgi:hypothetical protein
MSTGTTHRSRVAGLLVKACGQYFTFKLAPYPISFESPLRRNGTYWVTDPENNRHVALKTPSWVGEIGRSIMPYRVYLLELCD